MCTYENQESDLEGEAEDDNEAGIYVFVPGEYVFFAWCVIYFVWKRKDWL